MDTIQTMRVSLENQWIYAQLTPWKTHGAWSIGKPKTPWKTKDTLNCNDILPWKTKEVGKTVFKPLGGFELNHPTFTFSLYLRRILCVL